MSTTIIGNYIDDSLTARRPGSSLNQFTEGTENMLRAQELNCRIVFERRSPEWKDGEGPTPLSWRHGLQRRWHPVEELLYEARIDGRLAWVIAVPVDDDEATRLTGRLVHRNIVRPQDHREDGFDNADTELVPRGQS